MCAIALAQAPHKLVAPLATSADAMRVPSPSSLLFPFPWHQRGQGSGGEEVEAGGSGD